MGGRATLLCALLVLQMSLALPARGGGQRDTIVIGSKNFPESRLLGEMMALLLEEQTDFDVEHRSSLGGTLVCFTALRSGEIDLYPEYTGTAWSVILEEAELVGDPLRVFVEVQRLSRARFDLEWLPPFGFENTYAIAMREDRAQELGVSTLSELAGLTAHSLSAGFSAEFVNRADGWPGLAEHYGLELAQVRAMEHALAYEAVDQGSLDLVDAYSTDGKLAGSALRVLEDDRHFFPPYQAAPVVRGALLREAPAVRGVLERLSYRLTETRMIELNHAVEIEGRGFRDIAREFLQAEGLLAIGSEDGPDVTARDQESFVSFFLARRGETARLIGQHVWLTFLSVLIATALAVPLGVAVARSTWGSRLSLGAASIAQTVPSLALLAFMIAVPGLGLTTRSAITALTIYAVLPVLRNTVTGLASVDPTLVDAARGMGLTERQILVRVQLPLATRTIMAGIRTATVLTIGFATLAAFIGAGGLGEPILTGLYLNDVRLILAGALPAALLAIVADAALGRIERLLTPRGLRIN